MAMCIPEKKVADGASSANLCSLQLYMAFPPKVDGNFKIY